MRLCVLKKKIKSLSQTQVKKKLITTSVKQEPDFYYETGFQQNMNNALDFQPMKAELKKESDCADVVMCDKEDDHAWNLKLEGDDPEMAGCGVDGGLRERLKEELTIPDPKGNLNTVFFNHANNSYVCCCDSFFETFEYFKFCSVIFFLFNPRVIP